jgi:hypothetical protein
MSNSNLLQQDATAWLLAIGQRLRVEYEDLAEPMPPRLTALLKKSSRVMLKLTKRLLQVERLCSLCGLGKMII